MSQQTAQKDVIERYGPCGSQCPVNYSFQLQEGENIKEVIVRHGGIVDAIGFVVAKACVPTYTKMFGGCGGNESRIALKCDEQITQLSGTYGRYEYQNNECVIATIKIHTNQCPTGHGPYGKGEGVNCPSKFSSTLALTGPIVGVFGRHQNFLESVGILVNKMWGKDGPYGDQDADINYTFRVDPKKKERISKIQVRSNYVLEAIGFAKIDSSGAQTHTEMFGGNGGTLEKIELQIGDDITKITGKARNSQISQLMIYTAHNPKGYGPYGRNAYGEEFTSNVKNNTETVIGFFGSAGNKDVASIGLYVKQG